MKRFLTFAAVLSVLIAAHSVRAEVLRKLKYSSTSFDLGFARIEIDSANRAVVSWDYDPFRRPKPKVQPWKKSIMVKPELSAKTFAVLDEIQFSKIGSGREQAPDEPSVTFTELRADQVVHTVTHPGTEIPENLLKLQSVLKEIYNAAKNP